MKTHTQNQTDRQLVLNSVGLDIYYGLSHTESMLFIQKRFGDRGVQIVCPGWTPPPERGPLSGGGIEDY